MGGAKAQRIHDGDRPRPHREDVSQDPADARGRSLVGLDERGVVVGLDLEHRDETVADVDHARVLARPLDHPLALRRQRSQVDAAALVRAVLRPHHREDPELGLVRLASHVGDDALVFLGGQAVALEDARRDAAHAGTAGPISASKIARPSLDPSSGSAARSGWGIRPTTLRSALHTPATARALPLGFAAASGCPLAET